MPVSQKQIEANRRNAQKSTGPKTAAGKRASSRNAVKHGLYACDIILNSPGLSEDRAEYDQLVAALTDELKPQGFLQQHLVLKIANSLWRYRRVINAETASVNRRLENIADNIQRGYHDHVVDDPDNPESPEDILARRHANLLGSSSVPKESYRQSLMYYEMRLDRQLTRALRLLRQLQNPQPSSPPPTSDQKSRVGPSSDPPPRPPSGGPPFRVGERSCRAGPSSNPPPRPAPKKGFSRNEPNSDSPPE